MMITQRVSIIGRNIGGAFMLAVVFVMCANVIYRAFGGIIAGTFDLVELLIVPAIGFALVTVELEKRHIVVDILTSQFRYWTQSWLRIVMAVVSLIYWAAMCWAAWTMFMRKVATGENTQLLNISILPFRVVWAFALLWICFVIIINIREMLIKFREK